jgi:hypothetical protein
MPLHRVPVFYPGRNAGLSAPRLVGTIRGENKVQRQNQYRDLILVIAVIAEMAFRD